MTVKELVKKHKIPYLRLARNIGANISVAKRLYKWIYNTHIRSIGLAKTQYFGSLDDLIYLKQKKGKENFSCEIMVHPGLNNKKDVVDYNNMIFPLSKKLDENLDLTKTVSFIGGKQT